MIIKKCLVTGASGFLGQALCEELMSQGITVHRVVKNLRNEHGNDAFWTLDLGRQTLPDAALQGVEIVYHLAAIAHAGSKNSLPASEYYAVNYQAALDLFKQADRCGARRFVFVSSVKAAENPVATDDPYSHSKALAEQALLRQAENSRLELIILRPSLIYGSGVKGNLQTMAKAVVRGWLPLLPADTGRRSMVSRDDVVQALLLAAQVEGINRKVFTLADDQAMTAHEIQQAFRNNAQVRSWLSNIQVSMAALQTLARLGDFLHSVTGKTLPVGSEMLDKLFSPAVADAELAKLELGWQPRLTFNDQSRDILAALEK